MIPKIIHYSWFSGEEMPAANVQIMDTWKKCLPDYEFKLWDADALKAANLLFANEALSVKKWAFAADAIRAYAVYENGGIWLDGDVAVYQSFNPFLDCRMFIGKENFVEFQHDGMNQNMNMLTAHCFGAEKGHPFLRDCVEYYRDRHFIRSESPCLPQGLRYDMRLMPSILSLLAVKYGYRGRVFNVKDMEILDKDIHVYPPYYFDAPHYHKMEDSVCVHYKFGSWRMPNTWNPSMAPQKFKRRKNLWYYLYVFVNKILMKRGYWIKVISV